MFEVIQDWGVTKENLSLCDTYPLRVLTSTCEHIDPASVDVAMTLCPKVMVGTVRVRVRVCMCVCVHKLNCYPPTGGDTIQRCHRKRAAVPDNET